MAAIADKVGRPPGIQILHRSAKVGEKVGVTTLKDGTSMLLEYGSAANVAKLIGLIDASTGRIGWWDFNSSGLFLFNGHNSRRQGSGRIVVVQSFRVHGNRRRHEG